MKSVKPIPIQGCFISPTIATAQLQLNIGILNKFFTFDEEQRNKFNNLLPKFELCNNTPKSNEELRTRIKRRLSHIFNYSHDFCNAFCHILFFKIFYDETEYYIPENRNDVKQIVIQNISSFETRGIILSEKIVKQCSVSLSINNIHTIFIEITNWRFDKLENSELSDYDVIFVLQNIFNVLLKSYSTPSYTVKHVNEKLFKNIFYPLNSNNFLGVGDTLNELVESINQLSNNIKHAHTIYKLNTGKINEQLLTNINTTNQLIKNTINDLKSMEPLHSKNMGAVSFTFFDIMRAKMRLIERGNEESDSDDDMKIRFCTRLHDNPYDLTIFDKEMTFIDYIKIHLNNKREIFCMKRDYAIFREKLLFIVIHDASLTRETLGTRQEQVFADSYIVFTMSKFL